VQVIFWGVAKRLGCVAPLFSRKALTLARKARGELYRMAVRMLVFMTFYDLTTKHIRLTYEETFMDGVAMLSFFDASPNGSEA
jgi:hypothetical protein